MNLFLHFARYLFSFEKRNLTFSSHVVVVVDGHYSIANRQSRDQIALNKEEKEKTKQPSVYNYDSLVIWGGGFLIDFDSVQRQAARFPVSSKQQQSTISRPSS